MINFCVGAKIQKNITHAKKIIFEILAHLFVRMVHI